MSISEMIDSRRYSRDADGQRAGTRVFRVLNAQTEDAARVEWEGLSDGRVFPTDPALVWDRIDVQGTNGNTVYIVTATYTTFRGGRRQRDPETLPAEPVFGWGQAKETVDIPFAYQVDITTATGDQTATKTVWDAKLVKVVERRVRRTLRVEYTTTNTATLDVIAEQDHKVHKIRGKYYLFLGADVQQDSKDQTRFIITYSWELDNGTWVTSTDDTLIIFPDSPIPDPGDGLRHGYVCAPRYTVQRGDAFNIRKPYTTLDLIAPRNPETPPQAVNIQAVENDDDGWRSLPGMVPL